MRLQGDVAEILSAEHAELVRVMRGCAAPATAPISRATVTKGIDSKSIGPGVQRQHDRRSVVQSTRK